MRRIVRIVAAAMAGFAAVMVALFLVTTPVSVLQQTASAAAHTVYRIVIPPKRVLLARVMSRANVRREVKRAIRRGDCRLIGIGGIGLFFPGLEDRDNAVQKAVREFGYRFIEGTSDYAEDAEQAAYQQVAYNYARRYNLLLWPNLQSRCRRGTATAGN
jgi:hypothetical protein